VTKQRRRKRSGLRTLLLFVLTPLVVWLLAFLLWFYWDDGKLFRKDAARIPPAPKVIRKAEPSAKKPPEEKILDDDRRKLDEILKKKGG
jgi:hypothetical protein